MRIPELFVTSSLENDDLLLGEVFPKNDFLFIVFYPRCLFTVPQFSPRSAY